MRIGFHHNSDEHNHTPKNKIKKKKTVKNIYLLAINI